MLRFFKLVKEVWWSSGLVVRVLASTSQVPGSNIGPGGAFPQCGLRGGRSHCNNVQIK